MRKTLLLFSLFLVTLVAWGKPVDRNAALKQANAFLSSKGIPVRHSLNMAYAQPGKTAEAHSLYYVFNVGNDTMPTAVTSPSGRWLPPPRPCWKAMPSR